MIGQYLPVTYTPILGKFSKWFRYQCCKRVFKKCGTNVTIEKGAKFGTGFGVELGDNSGIGVDCHIPSDISIGNNVMMGPCCRIIAVNHCFERTDIPMNKQGSSEFKRTIIEDDVWIGANVLIMPGKTIKKGSIIAGGCVLTKNFPEYSIIGGNPSKLIKSRLNIKI